MGLIADKQSAMAHVLKTAGKARTWVAPGSAEKRQGLKSHPARSFSRRSARKRGNQRFGGLRSVITRAGSGGASRGSFPGKRWRGHQGGLMTVGPCDAGTAGAIVELSLFLEAPGHGQPHLQDLRTQRRRRRILQLVRRGHHGQRPQPPLPWPSEETSSRTKDTSTATRTHCRQCIRSTAPVPVVRF